MAVYVDRIMKWGRTASWPYEESCHLVADTLEELHELAESIGLRRQWFQAGLGHRVPHYDLTPNKRDQAIRNGALNADDDAVRGLYLDCLLWWRLKHSKRYGGSHVPG
jgi:hypothetical protein